ncbi:MAG: inositol monophosphatase family protein [Chloroflexota bacterium]
MSEQELRGWLDFALETADAASEIARRWFRRDFEVMTKPDRTYVTAADREVERLVRERIADRFPTHGVHGEEYGVEEGSADVRWWIDPIDGTANFVRGIPLFGVLLAAERGDEIVVGVVAAPALGERWYAAQGLGAWAEGPALLGEDRPRRIHVSAIASIPESQILYASHSDIVGSSEKAPGFGALVRDAWRDRGFGDFWGYTLVAQGAAEAMIETDLNPWDLAAPAVVVEEAGGRFSDLSGARTIHSGSAVATNGLLHQEILARLQEGHVSGA